MHNLKGYDGHLNLKALKSVFGKVEAIPQNMEKYLSLRVGKIKFNDSLQFTNQTLESLLKTLGDEEFRYLRESCISNHFGLGVSPYDRLDEIALPSQDSFFSKLSGSPTSDSVYTHATRVWNAFGC